MAIVGTRVSGFLRAVGVCAVVAGALLMPAAAGAQSMFEPEGCAFGVFFPGEPVARTGSLMVGAAAVDGAVAELTTEIKYVRHYFRADCINAGVPDPADGAALKKQMAALAAERGMELVSIDLEKVPDFPFVALMRVKGTIDGKPFIIDVRRFIKDGVRFDAWAGTEAEFFPTKRVPEFLTSVFSQGRFANPPAPDAHLRPCW